MSLRESATKLRKLASVPLGDYDDISIFGTDDQPTTTYGDLRAILGAFTREDVAMLRESQVWADSTDLRVNGEPADFENLAARIEALLPPEEK